jgi:protein-disulfide isomerase-like protein with CxxC motif
MASPSNYPAPFLEPLGQNLGEVLGKQIPGVNQPFDVSTIAPKVAQVNPFIQQAQQRAATQAGLGSLQFSQDTGALTGMGQGTGVAAYEPYLQRAEALFDPAAYKQYMSPYQTEVIDATQRLLDEQRAAGRSQLAANAIAQGAYGGGRSGVAQAEYERGRDITDTATLTGLRQQGLQSAQQLQQQGISNLTAFPGLQQRLDTGITSQLGLTGTGAQQYSQSLLDAIQQGNLLGRQYPIQELQQQSNIFGTLAQTSPGIPTQPMVTSPALTAAQAFGTVYGGLGSLYGRQG